MFENFNTNFLPKNFCGARFVYAVTLEKNPLFESKSKSTKNRLIRDPNQFDKPGDNNWQDG